MKKIGLLILILAIPMLIVSQNSTDANFKKLKFGLGLGYVHPNLVLKDKTSEAYLVNNNSGFTVYMLGEYSVNKFLSISPKAGFAFGQSTLTNTISGVSVDYEFMQISVDYLLDFVFKKWDSKLQPYLVIGLQYKTPVSDKNDIEEFKSSKNSFGISLGFGINKSFGKFIMNPEIRYSYGITDLKNSNQFPSLYYHSLSVLVNIKG